MVDQGNANIDNNQKPVESEAADACKLEQEATKNNLGSFYIERFLRALNECTAMNKIQ